LVSYFITLTTYNKEKTYDGVYKENISNCIK